MVITLRPVASCMWAGEHAWHRCEHVSMCIRYIRCRYRIEKHTHTHPHIYIYIVADWNLECRHTLRDSNPKVKKPSKKVCETKRQVTLMPLTGLFYPFLGTLTRKKARKDYAREGKWAQKRTFLRHDGPFLTTLALKKARKTLTLPTHLEWLHIPTIFLGTNISLPKAIFRARVVKKRSVWHRKLMFLSSFLRPCKTFLLFLRSVFRVTVFKNAKIWPMKLFQKFIYVQGGISEI